MQCFTNYDSGSRKVCYQKLLDSSGDWSSSLETRFALLGNSCQQLLDLGDGSAGVQSFGAGLGAVHDGVASVNTERIPESVKSLRLLSISAVNDPSVGLHQNSRAQVSVSIPPVAGARCTAASTENTLIESIQLCSVSNTLQRLLRISLLHLLLILSLEPGLNTPVLLVEVVHIRHQVLDNIHVRKRIDFGGFVISFNLGQTGESVHTSNIHGARSTDSLSARSSECETRIHFILDFDQSIQDHGTTVVEVNLIVLHLGLCSRLFRIPSVDGKSLLLL